MSLPTVADRRQHDPDAYRGQRLGRAHEIAVRKRHPHDRARLPVLYVTVPPAATPKMLAMEFARFFGLDFPARFNITDVVNAVCAAHVHVDLVAAPFSYAPGTDRDTWQSLVGTLESMLRLHDHQPGTRTGLGEYLYHRSGGMIGSLSAHPRRRGARHRGRQRTHHR